MKSLYLLVADHARAKLYHADCPPSDLTLVYHQVNFVGPLAGQQAGDADFAKSLCRMLKSDHQAGRFESMVVVTTQDFLTVIRRHIDRDLDKLLAGIVVPVPAQLGNPELLALLQNLLVQQAAASAGNSPATGS